MVGKIVRLWRGISLTVAPNIRGLVYIKSQWFLWNINARAARKLGEALIWAADKAEAAERKAH